MANPTPSNLTSCDEEVPLLGVTREFDFGQFIELFESSDDPNQPGVPIVARIVIQPSSTLAGDRNAAIGPPSAPQAKLKKSMQNHAILKPTPARPEVISIKPEVHLFDLVEHGPNAKLTPIPTEIKDRDDFFETGKVELEGKTYKVELDSSMREAMAMGLAVTVFAAPTEESGASIPLKLSIPFMPISLDKGKLSKVLAGDSLDTTAGSIKPVLTADAIRVLLNGGTVLTQGVDAKNRKTPLELYSHGTDLAPMSDRFDIFDLPSFLANPAVWAMNGVRLPVDIESEHVDQLITTGRTQIEVRNHSIELHVNTDKKSSDVKEFRKMESSQEGAHEGRDKDDPITIDPPVKPPGISWEELQEMIAASMESDGVTHFVNSGSGETIPSGKWPKTPRRPSSMTGMVQPRLPSGTGLSVAVFVPWKQTWTLKGFSRGNLLHSIALAPLEQVTLQVLSWERRSRSLEQSSETDIDQQTEVTQTTRDTEDVFREMLAKHDFAWQLSGALDASYNNGVASISFATDGSVSNTDSIQQTARNSSQHLSESTVKATSRVRSRRVTRIMQSVESGREERVTRLIRNPNQCHTLTFDFFETLAHYEISLRFIKERLRLVVLIPNPISHKDFSSEIIRRNETTFRNALIEPALVDGFDACQTVAAYDEARNLLARQQSETVKLDVLPEQRDGLAPTGAPDPAAPQEAEVKRVVDEMVAALKKIRGDAEIDTALAAIRDHSQVSEAARSAGQHWLFINFCAAKLSNALLATLDELSTGSTPTLPAAQKILAVMPRPDSPTNLGNLNQMSDREKEDSCIASKLREGWPSHKVYMQWDGDWSWWTGRLREEGLYTSNDAGLGGLADQLQKAYQAWEAKKAQGAAMKDQEVVKTEAEGRQNKAASDDKLTMAFPMDELARAYERSKVLRDHLSEHREFYNYALFQALPPSEQALRIVEASNGRLQVGLFEPRVVAMNGSRLVVPLTPLAGSQMLKDFVSDLADDLEDAFNNAPQTPDTTILPTPGVTISSRLDKCSGCEEYIEIARKHELARVEALAQQEQHEAERRQKRIEAKDYDDFRQPPPAVKLEVENKTPQ